MNLRASIPRTLIDNNRGNATASENFRDFQQLSLRGRTLANAIKALHEWKQVSVLSVESSRLPRWYQPGLLLIGDAAHVMSPVGGVGINYAIQDAAEAANLLSAPLRNGNVSVSDLAAVQKRREWPTRVIQAFQTFVQKRVIGTALNESAPFRLPLLLRLLLRLPGLRNLPARLIAFGPRRVRIE